jgi:hypothetical protein
MAVRNHAWKMKTQRLFSGGLMTRFNAASIFNWRYYHCNWRETCNCKQCGFRGSALPFQAWRDLRRSKYSLCVCMYVCTYVRTCILSLINWDKLIDLHKVSVVESTPYSDRLFQFRQWAVDTADMGTYADGTIITLNLRVMNVQKRGECIYWCIRNSFNIGQIVK